MGIAGKRASYAKRCTFFMGYRDNRPKYFLPYNFAMLKKSHYFVEFY